jgi:hypothetical protein
LLPVMRLNISSTVSGHGTNLRPPKRFSAFLLLWVCVYIGDIHADVAEYKLGDIATEDVVTPVPLVVPNSEGTEALKRRVASEVYLVVKLTTRTAADVETELRNAIAAARGNFASRFQYALGRAPRAEDVSTPLYSTVVASVEADSPAGLPVEKFARLWTNAQNDEVLLEDLLRPLRQAMKQPIVPQMDASLSTNQPLRFVAVKTANEVPTIQDLEQSTVPTSRKVIPLWRARRLVETGFSREEEKTGKFVASFVRPNAYPDPGLTEVLRARRVEGLIANDVYDIAQVIVRKGEVIDRKVMNALSAMREKTLIGTLQNKLTQEQTIAGQIQKQTSWIGASLAGVCLILIFILFRLRVETSRGLVPVSFAQHNSRLPSETAVEFEWRQRALVAEARVERAHEAIRSGALSWMREKLFRTLFRHRNILISVQQKAEREMRELELRLDQIHAPLQERITAYEKRIEELEKDLAAKGEENRQLIGARISVAKQQLIRERKRGRFGSN